MGSGHPSSTTICSAGKESMAPRVKVLLSPAGASLVISLLWPRWRHVPRGQRAPQPALHPLCGFRLLDSRASYRKLSALLHPFKRHKKRIRLRDIGIRRKGVMPHMIFLRICLTDLKLGASGVGLVIEKCFTFIFRASYVGK